MMPHDWINVHVDGDADARTVVKQCARCRLLAVVHESGTRAAIDYHPQHIRAPQDCPRGDMTEERASETAALRADLAAAIARAEAAEKERDEIVSAIIGHDNEDMKHDPKSVAQLVKDVLIERDDLARRLGEATELLRDALRNPPGQLTIQAAGTERDIRRWLATLTTPPADGDHAKTEQIERGDHAKGGG